MKIGYLKPGILLLVLLFSFRQDLFAKKRITSLKCEYIEAPLGLDVQRPRLMWKVDTSDVRGLYDVYVTVKSAFVGNGSDAKAANPDVKPLDERWITISACKSDQLNVEMKEPKVGKLTYALWQEMKKGMKVSNGELMRRIRRFVNANTQSRPQQPEMTGDGADKYRITDIIMR